MNKEKRVFNETKTTELATYDLELGYVKEDKLFVAHHAATAEVQEQSHVEVIAEYPNGGKDVQTVIDVAHKPAHEAYDEYEDINIFAPYTAAELLKRKERQYKSLIECKMRQKYSMNDEIAILRQRDVKQAEYAEYNAYAEQCKAAAKMQQTV